MPVASSSEDPIHQPTTRQTAISIPSEATAIADRQSVPIAGTGPRDFPRS